YKLRNGPGPAEFRQKLNIIMVLASLALLVLTVRLWHLQVIKGDELKQRSENNAVRFRKIQPLRGLVMDRNGRVIAENRPSFDVLYMPTKGIDPEALVQKIKDIYKTRSVDYSSDQPFPKSFKSYLPVRLEKNVGMEKVALVETNSVDLPGVYVDVTPIRLYQEGEFLAPIIGYTGEVSKEELEKSEEYTFGDITGKSGIEKVY